MLFGDGNIPVKDTKFYTDKPIAVIPQEDNNAVAPVQDSAVEPPAFQLPQNPQTWAVMGIAAIVLLLALQR